jgi:hypothetical protein
VTPHTAAAWVLKGTVPHITTIADGLLLLYEHTIDMCAAVLSRVLQPAPAAIVTPLTWPVVGRGPGSSSNVQHASVAASSQPLDMLCGSYCCNDRPCRAAEGSRGHPGTTANDFCFLAAQAAVELRQKDGLHSTKAVKLIIDVLCMQYKVCALHSSS